MRSKEEVRHDVWRSMDREGVSRFPGAEGRIPNFAGAKAAAERLTRHSDWQHAETIKANPDSPQTHARRMALEQGKVLVMAVPRLRDQHPFRLLDPKRLTKAQVREADAVVVERALDGLAGSADLMAERVEKILEHHRNQRFVLDNED